MDNSRQTINISIKEGTIAGNLTVPPKSQAIVLFAHGSGSSRHSPRNTYVAEILNRNGFSTLLLDLLTDREEVIDQTSTKYRFDVELLSQRLSHALFWLRANVQTAALPVGLFGASTGSAAALIAAAKNPALVKAVVSRGGRPDLARTYLPAVLCPSLFIVGQLDPEVAKLNGLAMMQLSCINRLEIVPNTAHLFEEPGALSRVAQLASNWFDNYLLPQTGPFASKSFTPR